MRRGDERKKASLMFREGNIPARLRREEWVYDSTPRGHLSRSYLFRRRTRWKKKRARVLRDASCPRSMDRGSAQPLGTIKANKILFNHMCRTNFAFGANVECRMANGRKRAREHDERLMKNGGLSNTEHTESPGKEEQDTTGAKGQQLYRQVGHQEIKDERKTPSLAPEVGTTSSNTKQRIPYVDERARKGATG